MKIKELFCKHEWDKRGTIIDSSFKPTVILEQSYVCVKCGKMIRLKLTRKNKSLKEKRK